jgi:putative redox protein
VTDAPTDNGGKGKHFSPTDLVGTALGTCVLTIMGIYAERNGIDIVGSRIHVEKHMASQPVRRIGRLEVVVTIPPDKATRLDEGQRERLERAAGHCPVHASLHPDVACEIRFVYGKA